MLDEAAHGALDDSLKTLYVQNTENKNFYLDVAPDEAAKLAFNLQSQFQAKKDELTRVHTEKNTLKAEVDAFKAIGKTPDELKTAIESNRPEDVTKLVTDYETKMADLKRSFEEPLTKAEERSQRLAAQVEQSLTDSEIANICQQFGINTAGSFVLRNYIKAVPSPTDENPDAYAIKVFENGKLMQIAGQDISAEQLVKGFQEQKKFPEIFTVGDGAGTGNTNRNTVNLGDKKFEGLTGTEKLKAARQAAN